jgi:hypothetical protein
VNRQCPNLRIRAKLCICLAWYRLRLSVCCARFESPSVDPTRYSHSLSRYDELEIAVESVEVHNLKLGWDPDSWWDLDSCPVAADLSKS